jgi:hypothetical protein
LIRQALRDRRFRFTGPEKSEQMMLDEHRLLQDRRGAG